VVHADAALHPRPADGGAEASSVTSALIGLTTHPSPGYLNTLKTRRSGIGPLRLRLVFRGIQVFREGLSGAALG
jgi:hypothetical protein